jgi:hypothetical protein
MRVAAAHSLTVLKNLDAVAVEPADNRARRRGTETARCDPWLVFERRAERHAERFGELLARKNCGRLIDLEVTSCFACDGRLFLEMQLRVHRKITQIQFSGRN